MVNDLLKELTERGCRVVTYTDDVALFMTVKLLKTVYNLTYLTGMVKWADRNGLAINPNKTNVV